MDNDAVRERNKDSVRDEQAFIAIVDEVIANGEGQLVCRPQEPILLARDGYERYLDGMREPSDRLATKLIPGVEEAWDALTARTEVMPLLTYEELGAGPGGDGLDDRRM